MSDYRSIFRSLTALFSHRPNKRQRKRGKLRPEGFSAHFAGLQDSRLTRVLHACESLEMRAMLSAMPIVASAESDFIFSNGVITGYIGTGGDVVIPASIRGVAVTAIGNSAFSQNSALTAVTLPSGLISIGHDAFSGCPGLLAVTIPASVTSIASAAFGSCSNLAGITVLPGNQAFSSEHGLLLSADGKTLVKCPAGKTGDLVVPSHVTTIGDHAFVGCASLSTVAIPSSVSSVGNWAFERCTGLVAITIPSSVTGIGWRAFIGCEKLTDITVVPGSAAYSSRDGFLLSADGTTLVVCPAGKVGVAVVPVGVTSIGDSSFFGCKLLTSIAFPDSVTRIDGWAFYDCTGLKTLDIPLNVTAIGNFAFGWCTGVSTLTIPSSVISIGDRAFYCCFSLKSIAVMPGNTAYSSRDGFLLNADGTTLVVCPAGSTGVVVVPMGVTRIENAAFVSCGAVSTIAFPATVTDIGSQACAGCHGLSRIYFAGDAPASVGADAFSEVSGAVYYTAGTKGWTNLFYGLATVSVTYETGDFRWALISNGGVTITGYTGLGGNVVIPDSIDGLPVSSVGSYAFASIGDKLTGVTFPVGLVSIGNYVFVGCTQLAEARIPASVTSFGFGVFAWCTRLVQLHVDARNINYVSEDGVIYDKDFKSLIAYPAGRHGAYAIRDGITSIGYEAFRGSKHLTEVDIPASVSSIGHSAFSDCTSLASVTIPEGVSAIGTNAFTLCSGLTRVTLLSKSATFGPAAFSECVRLASVVIPEGISAISDSMFNWCTALVSLTIPRSVTRIGDQAFNGCSSLVSLTFLGNAPQVGRVAFFGADTATAYFMPGTQGWLPQIGELPTAQVVLPSQPESLAAVRGNGNLTLTWNTPAFNGGAPTSDYVIQYRLANSSAWTTFPHAPSMATTAAVTGLKHRHAYVFRVAAVNALGQGNWSNQSGAIVPLPTPSAPGRPSVVAGNGVVSLRFSAPQATGGLRVTDYVIQYSANSGVSWTTAVDSVSPSTTATVRGLSNGTPYVFRVAAVTLGGIGAFSVSSAQVIPYLRTALPAAPTSVTGVGSGGIASLSWAASSSNAGGPIRDYVIQFRTTVSGSRWFTYTDGVTSANAAAVRRLVAGRSYIFRVAAKNLAGQGAFSNPSAVIRA